MEPSSPPHEPSPSARSSRGYWLVGLGLITGAVTGLLLLKRKAPRTSLTGDENAPARYGRGRMLSAGRMLSTGRKIRHLDIWQQALLETQGPVQSALTAARIEARYALLLINRPRFDDPVLRMHLEERILPGLALYQVLKEDLREEGEQAVLAELDRLLEASAQHSPMMKWVNALNRTPRAFDLFRLLHGWALSRLYPASGWDFRPVENSKQVVAFNCVDCFYQRVLAHYAAPELTAHFCRLDDITFSRLTRIRWARTQTLAQGSPYCDFRFEKGS